MAASDQLIGRVRRALAHATPAALSVAARLASGLVLFVLIARAIGPTQFGFFASVLSLATLFSLLTHLGLPLLLLTDGAGGGHKLWLLLAQCIKIKNRAAAIALAGAPLALFYDVTLGSVFVLLVAATIAEGYSDLFLSARRAGERHASELKYSILLSSLNLACVGTSLMLERSIVAISIGYLAGRFIGAGILWIRTRREIESATAAATEASSHFAIFRRTRANFSELVAQTILIQIDTVLVASFSGATQAGLYQAAIRLVHGISQVITVVANVAIPRAAKHQSPHEREPILKLAGLALAAMGLLVLCGLVLLSEQVASLLFGARYAGLAPVLSVAAVVVLVRFLAAAEGLRMIVFGWNRPRLVGLVLALLVALAAAMLLVPARGAAGMMMAMAAAYSTIYLVAIAHRLLLRPFRNNA